MANLCRSWRNSGLGCKLYWVALIHQPHKQPWVLLPQGARWMDPCSHAHLDHFPADPKMPLEMGLHGVKEEVTASWPLQEPRWSLWGCIGCTGWSCRTIALLVSLALLVSSPSQGRWLILKSYSLLSSCPQIAVRVLYTSVFVSFCSWCCCFQTSVLKFSFLVT